MSNSCDATGYVHAIQGLQEHHANLLPTLDRILGPAGGRSVFEIGFGNGAVSDYLNRKGFSVTGVEPSEQGVSMARAQYPQLTKLCRGSAYDNLSERYGTFDVVLSLEVIEHLYAPRKFVATAHSLLKPNGLLILSTPYHGYLKNVAIVILGKFDHHFDPLWDHGHIKFWSIKKCKALLEENEFSDFEFYRVGRIPPLAKSMIVRARRSAASHLAQEYG